MLISIYSYGKVRAMQVDHLVSAIRFGVNEEVTKSLYERIDEKVDAYANGNLDHAAEAMSLLWEASKKSRRSALAPRDKDTLVCPPPLLTSSS